MTERRKQRKDINAGIKPDTGIERNYEISMKGFDITYNSVVMSDYPIHTTNYLIFFLNMLNFFFVQIIILASLLK